MTDVLGGLASMVDKSLVLAVDEQDGRFSMLETIREFALEKLKDSGELEAIRRVHAEFFGELAEEAEPNLTGRSQTQWFDRLEEDHDNLRTALTGYCSGTLL
jgi:predicted ATPase